MDCQLVRSVSVQQIKSKRMLLKSGKQAASTDERIPKDLWFESLSTNESDNFNNYGSMSTSISKSSRSSGLEMCVEEHPLFTQLTQKQIDTYYDFTSLAHDEYKFLSGDSKKVAKTCLNDINLLRFLKARNFKIPAALKMWSKWVTWKHEFKVPKKEDVDDFEMKRHFKVFKHDKENNPLVVISPGNFEGEVDAETTIKVCVYTIEKAIRRSNKKSNGMLSVVFDRQGMTQSKDKKWFPVFKKMGQVLQDYYPERLKVAYIVNCNWFTKIIISMVKVFLSKDTKQKLCTIKNNKDLLKYFDEACLPKKYRSSY